MEITLPSFVDSPEWRIAQWKSYCSTTYKHEVTGSNPGWH